MATNSTPVDIFIEIDEDPADIFTADSLSFIPQPPSNILSNLIPISTTPSSNTASTSGGRRLWTYEPLPDSSDSEESDQPFKEDPQSLSGSLVIQPSITQTATAAHTQSIIEQFPFPSQNVPTTSAQTYPPRRRATSAGAEQLLYTARKAKQYAANLPLPTYTPLQLNRMSGQQNPPAATSKFKIREPPDFEGYKGYRSWLQKIEIYQRALEITDDEKKVLVALSYMTGGPALEWCQAFTDNALARGDFGTWTN